MYHKLNFIVKVLIASIVLTFLFSFTGKSVAHADTTNTLDLAQIIDIAISNIETATATVQSIETTTATSVNNITPIITLSSDTAIQLIESATAIVKQAQIALQDQIQAQLSVDTATIIVQSTQTILKNDSQAVNTLQAQVESTTVVSNGITATIYNDRGYNASPPLGAGTIVKTMTVSNINFQWGNYGPVAGLNDDFQVHFQGSFTPNVTGTMWLTPQADDGTILTIGNSSINDWRDKGGGGGTLAIQTTAGQPMSFDLWFYENGGGANVVLLWYTNIGWQVVPSSAFNTITVDPVLVQNLADAKNAYNDALNNYSNATNDLSSASDVLTQANQVLTSAVNAIAPAISDMNSSIMNLNSVVNDQVAKEEAIRQANILAEQQKQAAIAAENARIAAIEAARAEAEAIKAEANAKAAADAAAKALADQQAADAAKTKAEADALAAQQAADKKAKQDAADAKAKADQEAANAKAEADKKAADKAAQDAANKAADAAAKEQSAKDAQAKAYATKATEDKAKQDAIGVKPNNPNQLSDIVVKEAPKEVLVPHIQVDVKGVENGGIQFFGTKSAPQVVGEDGHLTPSAPPPGSGLPIPADAITTVDTFIGQPGGTSFNAPDIAVPVILTPVTGALAAVPGVQAVNQAFVAMANIGNDMSPVTRKKAKKILVLTIAVAAIRRRFGQ